MNVQPDKDQWYEKAECKGTGPWVFADEPSPDTVDYLLSICDQCPVMQSCGQDLVNTGDRHPYQVRAGLRLWTDDKDLLPSVLYLEYTPPKRAAHRPRGPLSILHIKPSSGKNFNPHTRGPWNTPS